MVGAILGVGVATALAVVTILQWDRVLPNTALGGLEVGDLEPAGVETRLVRLEQEHRTAKFVFTFNEAQFTFRPDDVTWRIDVDASVETAMNRGRQGGMTGIVERLTSYFRPTDLTLSVAWDDAALTRWIDDVAATIDRQAYHGEIAVDPVSLVVEAALPYGSAALDRLATRQLLTAWVLHPPSRDEQRPLPVDETAPLVDPGEFAALAEQFRQAVAAPMRFDTPDGVFVLSRPQIAQLLHVARTTDGERQRVTLGVSAAAVNRVIDFGTQRAFDSEPVDARILVDREPAVTFDAQGAATFEPVEVDVEILPGRDGARFDAELFAQQVTSMLTDGVRRSLLALELTPPSLTTEDAQEHAPTHLIGTFTTYHEAGQTRVHNIQLLADTIDGAVVPIGEQFSINEISGRRTCEKGYRPAGTIIRGELVDTCGGGTSQFGTTTFNAAFFAAVQLDQWRAHSWYISRYPMGREATLSYPELDVKFTNTTEGLVVVRASYTPSSITVSLYGRPAATAVRAQLGNPTNPRPPTTQVRWTNELFEGQERTIQSAGSNGFTVRVTRHIDWNDGTTTSQQFDTVYQPQHRIVERGTRPRPS